MTARLSDSYIAQKLDKHRGNFHGHFSQKFTVLTFSYSIYQNPLF